MCALDSVALINAELGYTPDVEERLKRESAGVARTLTGLRTKAKSDPSYEARYRQTLQKALEQLGVPKPGDDLLTADAARAEADSFRRFYEEERQRLNIAEREARRLPHGAEEWAQKWLPTEWQQFDRMQRVVAELPTVQSYRRLRAVTIHMLERYVSIFD
jgi:hypothetical protein